MENAWKKEQKIDRVRVRVRVRVCSERVIAERDTVSISTYLEQVWKILWKNIG